MSKESSPAFQCYAAEYLADVNTQLMTVEEEGCYWRLMLFCWREKSLPRDIESLTALCKGVTPTNRVVSCFTVFGDRLVHDRLERERLKQEEWRIKSAKGGRHSAHKPKSGKHKVHEQGGTTTVLAARYKGGSTLQSSSSSSTSSCNTPHMPPRGRCELGACSNGNREQCTASFDRFWSEYPRHEPGKTRTMKAWCKAWRCSGPLPLESILGWISQAKTSDQWQDSSLIPHATTWLNQRRWEGDPPPKPSACRQPSLAMQLFGKEDDERN